MLKLNRPAVKAAALVLAVLLAPAAQAQQQAPSRDTGVGKEIAAQGNRALQLIRAELKAAVTAMRPALPPPARVVKMSLPAGSVLAAGADVALDQ
jgi:hypothetical protein